MKGATTLAGLFGVGLLAMIAPTGAGAQSAITEQEAHAIGVDPCHARPRASRIGCSMKFD